MPRSLGPLLVSFLTAAVLVPVALAASGSPHASAAVSPKLVVAASQFGPVLFNQDGRALYGFTRDSRGRSACSGECAVKWPPFLVTRKVAAGSRVEASRISTIRRADGSTQVVYAGHPLYFYKGDPKGKLLCGNFKEFGGLWLAVAASGKLVK
jgi:predicted lipoprotein with Yx(FWY)xxD motif